MSICVVVVKDFPYKSVSSCVSATLSHGERDMAAFRILGLSSNVQNAFHLYRIKNLKGRKALASFLLHHLRQAQTPGFLS